MKEYRKIAVLGSKSMVSMQEQAMKAVSKGANRLRFRLDSLHRGEINKFKIVLMLYPNLPVEIEYRHPTEAVWDRNFLGSEESRRNALQTVAEIIASQKRAGAVVMHREHTLSKSELSGLDRVFYDSDEIPAISTAEMSNRYNSFFSDRDEPEIVEMRLRVESPYQRDVAVSFFEEMMILPYPLIINPYGNSRDLSKRVLENGAFGVVAHLEKTKEFPDVLTLNELETQLNSTQTDGFDFRSLGKQARRLVYDLGKTARSYLRV